MPHTSPQPLAPVPAITRSGGRRRAGALAAAVALVMLAVTACSSDDGEAAITVGSRSVPASTFEKQLDAIKKNKVLKDQVVQDGKLDAGAVSTWATNVVQSQVAVAAVKKAKGEVTSEDRAEALNRAREFFGSDAAFDAFPDWFKAGVLGVDAFVPAYIRMNTPRPTEAVLRQAYDESLTRNCASKRYVSRIVTTTEATASAAAAEVAGGADFGQVAGRVSTDQQSAQAGGALGCLDGQQVDATLAATAAATPLGQVSAPFSTPEGWQVVKVVDVATALPYDEVKSEIRTELQYGRPGQEALAKAVAGADVTIQPRFGRWVVREGRGMVVERTPASSSSSSSSSTTTTTKG